MHCYYYLVTSILAFFFLVNCSQVPSEDQPAFSETDESCKVNRAWNFGIQPLEKLEDIKASFINGDLSDVCVANIAIINDNLYVLTPSGKLWKKGIKFSSPKEDAFKSDLSHNSLKDSRQMIAVGNHLVILNESGEVIQASIGVDGLVSQIQEMGTNFINGKIANVDNENLKNFLILKNEDELHYGNVDINKVMYEDVFKEGMNAFNGMVFTGGNSLFFKKSNDSPTKVIWVGKDLLVRFVDFNTDTIFVVFQSYNDTEKRYTNEMGQSEAYFIKNGISAIFVNNLTANWYQTHEMSQILPQIKDILKKHDHIISYGSSMGGFAALVFSKELNAERVVAFDPQVLFNAYPMFLNRIKKIKIDTLFTVDTGLSTSSQYFIFYSEGNPHDRKGIEDELESIRLAKGINTNFHKYPVPQKVHNVQSGIQKAGYLGIVNEAVMEGDYQKLDNLFQKGTGEAWIKIKSNNP